MLTIFWYFINNLNMAALAKLDTPLEFQLSWLENKIVAEAQISTLSATSLIPSANITIQGDPWFQNFGQGILK